MSAEPELRAGPTIGSATTEPTRHARALLLATAGQGSYGALGIVADLCEDAPAHLAALETMIRQGAAPAADHDTLREALDLVLAPADAHVPPGATLLLIREGLAWCVHAGPGACLLRRGTQWFEMTARHEPHHGPLRARAWSHPMVLEAGDRFVLVTGETIATLGIDRLQQLATRGAADDDAHAIIRAVATCGDGRRAGVVIADLPAAVPPP